ncbi:MAG: hypothetical protein AB7P03_19180 [Kofleriaceae bacterium]
MRSSTRVTFWVAATLVAGTAAPSNADIRGTFRLGVQPLTLEPSASTPVFGGYLDDAVLAYNAAAAAYNERHGYRPGSRMAAASVDRGDLALRTTLVTFAPGIEAGGDGLFFRAQGELGFAGDHRLIGIGLYPVNVSVPLRRGTFVPYAGIGGSAGVLQRTDVDSGMGGLLSARLAVGARVHGRIIVELGYSLAMIGGVVDTDRIDTMTSYDPSGNTPPPPADLAAQGGEQRGAFDLSIGVSL